jgi:hypothetical protein
MNDTHASKDCLLLAIETGQESLFGLRDKLERAERDSQPRFLTNTSELTEYSLHLSNGTS